MKPGGNTIVNPSKRQLTASHRSPAAQHQWRVQITFYSIDNIDGICDTADLVPNKLSVPGASMMTASLTQVPHRRNTSVLTFPHVVTGSIGVDFS